MRILLVLLFSSLFLTGCSSSEAQVMAKETIVSKEVVELSEDEIPTFEEVLFVEVPNSREAARSFLNMIHDYDMKVKHVTIKDYGESNYTLDCTFTNEDYTIMLYVRHEDECTKWYGNLLREGNFVRSWEYKVNV